MAAETLESRRLLTISLAAPTVAVANSRVGLASVQLNWSDTNSGLNTYDVWVDQTNVSPGNTHLTQVIRDPGFKAQGGSNVVFSAEEGLAEGTYKFWLRSTSPTVTPWVSIDFTVDIDNHVTTTPDKVEVTTERHGQGFGVDPDKTEFAIGWDESTNGSGLYVVDLHEKVGNVFTQRSFIRNVPRRFVTGTELADYKTGADQNYNYYGSVRRRVLDNNLTTGAPTLDPGDYRIRVMEINDLAPTPSSSAAIWSDWYEFDVTGFSSPDDGKLSYTTSTSPQPGEFTVTDEVLPTVTWGAVQDAELYELKLYNWTSNLFHTISGLTGTSYSFEHWDVDIPGWAVNPGTTDVSFTVYARDQHNVFPASGHNYHRMTIPNAVSGSGANAPTITGPPPQSITDGTPTIAWEKVSGALDYEVWVNHWDTTSSSWQVAVRADNVDENFFLMDPDRFNSSDNAEITEFQPALTTIGQYGRTVWVEGLYRAWIRSTDGTWAFRDFQIQAPAGPIADVSTSDSLTSPNAVRGWTDSTGNEFLLIGTGQGETSDGSVLARYQYQGSSLVKTDNDLPVGFNVSAMELMTHNGEDYLLVASRGSSEVRIVDLENWEVVGDPVSLNDDWNAGLTNSQVDDLEAAGNAEPGAITVVDAQNILVGMFGKDGLAILEFDGSELRRVNDPNGEALLVAGSEALGRVVSVENITNGSVTKLSLATPASDSYHVVDYQARSITSPTKIVRSSNSVPHVASASVTVGSDNFFITSDRNGFLTAVNAATNNFSHFDLVEVLANRSRDPGSAEFVNVNDAGVDPFDIRQIGNDPWLLVTNNRQNSVLLKMTVVSGNLAFETQSAVEISHGGTFGEVLGSRAFISGPGEHRVAIQPLSQSGSDWSLNGTSDVQIFAVPYDHVAPVKNGGLLVSRRDELIHIDGSTGVVNSSLSLSYGGYTVANGVLASWHSGGLEYYFVQGARPTVDPNDDPAALEFALLVLDASVDPTSPVFFKALSLSDLQGERSRDAFSIDVTADSITVLNRADNRMVEFHDWQTSSTPTVTELERRQEARLGAVRPGDSVYLGGANDPLVLLNDTEPSIGYTVFENGDSMGTPVFHRSAVGKWTPEFKRLDSERILTLTFDAQIHIFNVSTGVYELVHNLDPVNRSRLDLSGASDFSLSEESNGRRLISVSSPSTGTVGIFRLSNTSTGYKVELARVIHAPNVKYTLFAGQNLWIMERERIWWHNLSAY